MWYCTCDSVGVRGRCDCEGEGGCVNGVRGVGNLSVVVPTYIHVIAGMDRKQQEPACSCISTHGL